MCVFSTTPFYSTYVYLPDANSPTSSEIWNPPKFYPFFDGALGATDGTHIICTSPNVDHDATRNCKGIPTQNCLVVCFFDLHFTYLVSGWKGSTAAFTVFNAAHLCDFYIPEKRYYLIDAGFVLCPHVSGLHQDRKVFVPYLWRHAFLDYDGMSWFFLTLTLALR